MQALWLQPFWQQLLSQIPQKNTAKIETEISKKFQRGKK